MFITGPHVVQDLPFSLHYLTNGKILETPNITRSMIPQRISDQYRQFCSEINLTPFSTSKMLRILSSSTATVRKSSHGLDYFAAEGAKAFEDLMAFVEKHGDRQWVHRCQQTLKEGKQYFKTDYNVSITMLHVLYKLFKQERGVYFLRVKCWRQGTFTLPPKRSNY